MKTKMKFQKVLTAAACMSAAVCMASVSVIPEAQQALSVSGYQLTAFAADHTADMVANPAKYFDFQFRSDGGCDITSYIGTDTVIRIPGTIYGRKVKRVGTGGYLNPFFPNDTVCKSVTSIKIDKNVEEIGEYTFNNCTSLTTVKLPTTINTIGSEAFASCTNLRTVDLRVDVPKVSPLAFDQCLNITNAYSTEGALALLFGGAKQVAEVNHTPIVIDTGCYKKPDLNPYMKYEILERFGEIEDSRVVQDYQQLYAEYLVHDVLKISSCKTDVEKAAKIFRYIKSHVSYDNEEVHYITDKNGRLEDIVKENKHPNSYAAGSALWGTHAVCQGYSKAAALLLQESGILTYNVSALCVKHYYKNGTYQDDTVGHMFNVVRIARDYYIIDLTEDYTNGFLISAARQQKKRETLDPATWEFCNYQGSPSINNAEKLTHELGDLNRSGIVDNPDYTYFDLYCKGSASDQANVLRTLNMTKEKFEMIADANGDGNLDWYSDRQQMDYRRDAGKKYGFC